MKIVLIHGDNRPKVQERVRTIVDGVRKKGWKIARVNKDANLAETFMSNTLLPESKLCIFEGVSNLKKEQVEWLKENAMNIDGSFLIVHNGDAPKKILQPIAKQLTEEYFTFPKILFKYLETIAPGKAPNALKIFHELVETESVELVSAMMGRHFRDLYWVKIDPDTVELPGWRVKKLTAQANTFTVEKLERVMEQLASADYASKSGGVSLLTSLDLLLMRELA